MHRNPSFLKEDAVKNWHEENPKVDKLNKTLDFEYSLSDSQLKTQKSDFERKVFIALETSNRF